MSKRPFRVEREFGLIVGGVFTLLGVWWLYRGKFFAVSRGALVLGLLLVLLGLVAPKLLVYPNRYWMKMAEAMAYVMTRLILGVVFFLVVTPIGFIKRMTGWDPLNRRAGSSESYWAPYSERQRDRRHYEKMY
jgi:Saxitoxin biosynthesis operon protein SxtJ